MLIRCFVFDRILVDIDSILPIYMSIGNYRASQMKSTDKQSSKRVRNSDDDNDDDLQSTLNVFDILNQSESNPSKRHE